MRTTLAIDDDILAATKELAQTEGKSIGEMVSFLVRKALNPPQGGARLRNGIPLLEVGPNAPRVTSEFVKQLAEELP